MGSLTIPLSTRRVPQKNRDISEHCLSAINAEHSASCAAPDFSRNAGYRSQTGEWFGCLFFWLLFFGQAKKSNPPQPRSGGRNFLFLSSKNHLSVIRTPVPPDFLPSRDIRTSLYSIHKVCTHYLSVMRTPSSTSSLG